MGSPNEYCLGSLKCNVTSVTFIFAVQLIYVLFWTWILNLMCNTGVEKLAWVLVIIPIYSYVFSNYCADVSIDSSISYY